MLYWTDTWIIYPCALCRWKRPQPWGNTVWLWRRVMFRSVVSVKEYPPDEKQIDIPHQAAFFHHTVVQFWCSVVGSFSGGHVLSWATRWFCSYTAPYSKNWDALRCFSCPFLFGRALTFLASWVTVALLYDWRTHASLRFPHASPSLRCPPCCWCIHFPLLDHFGRSWPFLTWNIPEELQLRGSYAPIWQPS